MRNSLREVELLRIRMPLVHGFRTAHGTTASKDALLVRVGTDDGEGWSECVAPLTPTYGPDTIEGARVVLRDHLLPRAFAGSTLDDVRGHRAARAALEDALLDASLRARGESLAAHLGAVRTHVDAGVVIGIVDDEAALRDLVARYVGQGYRRIKCKIDPGHDAAVLAAARAEAGDGIELAADANGSYRLDDAGALRALDAYSLQCLEQPLAPDAVLDHAALASRLRTRVCLDETVTSARVAADVIALGACGAISLKAGRVGGLAAARRVHDVAAAAGVPMLAGGMLETGLGRAALLAVAALPGCTLTGDCSASDRYFAADLTEPFVLDGGRLPVPAGPGLGVEVRAEQVGRYTVARELIRPGC